MINDWKLKIESKETNASVKHPVGVFLRERETQSVTLLMVKKTPFFLAGVVDWSYMTWLLQPHPLLANIGKSLSTHLTEEGKRRNVR